MIPFGLKGIQCEQDFDWFAFCILFILLSLKRDRIRLTLDGLNGVRICNTLINYREAILDAVNIIFPRFLSHSVSLPNYG